MKRSITFFQGIYVGMALLFTITLNLSTDISQDLVRVEDQAIRVISLLSSLGAIYSAIRAKDQCNSSQNPQINTLKLGGHQAKSTNAINTLCSVLLRGFVNKL